MTSPLKLVFPTCSFCAKTQHEIKKLIAAPGVYICDECVDLCSKILSEECNIKRSEDELPKPVAAIPQWSVKTIQLHHPIPEGWEPFSTIVIYGASPGDRFPYVVCRKLES